MNDQRKCLVTLLSLLIAIINNSMPVYAQDTTQDGQRAIDSTYQLTEDEINMILYVVANEVGNCDSKSKLLIANAILNRLDDPRFPDTITDVLHAEDQFAAINNYYNRKIEPDQDTIDMVLAALNGEDNSVGAMVFYAPKYISHQPTIEWFESLDFVTEHEGIRYFRI